MTRLNIEVARRNLRFRLRHPGLARLCPEVRPLNTEVALRNRGFARCCGKVAPRNMKLAVCNKRAWPALIPAFSPGEKERENATAIHHLHLRVRTRLDGR